MSDKTKIAWTDSTVNFWSGCTKVSPGCLNCYAKTRDDRQMQEEVSHWGKGAPRLKHKGAVKDALALNRKPWICDRCGEAFATTQMGQCQCLTATRLHRRRIFSLSLGDWLDEEVPIEWLAEMLDTIRKCDSCDWLLLTKRPENWKGRIEAAMMHLAKTSNAIHQCDGRKKDCGCFSINRTYDLAYNWVRQNEPPRNIWLGTSTENQEQADKRIPELLKIPAAVRFLSVEPMLGRVVIPWKPDYSQNTSTITTMPGIHWAIFGGESGKGARPCNVQWIRDGVRQCHAAGVKAFVKQLGTVPSQGNVPTDWKPKHGVNGEDWEMIPLKDPKGGDMSEWPEDLRVREFPKL